MNGRLVPLETPHSEQRDVFGGVGSGLSLWGTLPCQQGSASHPKKKIERRVKRGWLGFFLLTTAGKWPW